MSLRIFKFFLAVAFPTIAATSICPLPSPWLQICPALLQLYTVQPSADKGLGVFANYDLDIGDIVMREKPIIKIQPPAVVPGTGYPMDAVAKLVRAQFDTLPIHAQEEIISLTYYGTHAEEEVLDILGAIFRTNAYNSGDNIGLFPRIARINHSCRPNTSYYWDEKSNKRIVYASRKIKAGEEFFVSYIPLLLTREERQKLLDRYGFQCRCEACAQMHEKGRASDNRRVTIGKAFVDFEPQLSITSPKSTNAFQQATKNAQASIQLNELVHEEGLSDYYAKAYRVAAISHARIKKWEAAAVWANKGYELKYMEDPTSPYTMEMHNLTSTFIMNWEKELRQVSQRERAH